MTTTAVTCPSCGATINVDLQDRSFVFCSYCGQQISITDENSKKIQITKHIIDEADIIRAKNEGTLTPAEERIERERIKHQAKVAKIQAKERTKIALAQMNANNNRPFPNTPARKKRGCCGSFLWTIIILFALFIFISYVFPAIFL